MFRIEYLEHHAHVQPEKVAVIFQNRRITYDELNRRANMVAHALLKLGLKRGDMVSYMLNNCPECIELMFGLNKAGIGLAPINMRFVGSEIEYIVNNSDTKALFVGEEFADRVKEVKNRFEKVGPNNYVSIGKKNIDGMIPYEEFLAGASDQNPGVEQREENIFFIGYTSGYTGKPKGAVILNKHFDRMIASSAVEFGLTGNDVMLLVMPLFHVNSIGLSSLQLCLGGTVVLAVPFNPAEILELIDREKATCTSLVPTMFYFIMLLPDEVKNKYDMSSLRFLWTSSAPLTTNMKEWILSFFKNAGLFEMYGSTEIGAVTNLRPKDQFRKIRCCGKVTIGNKIRLLDDNGYDVPAGQVGELYVKQDNRWFKEYYKNPEATSKAFRGEWMTVGDMARMDEEGYYSIVDRKNDMLISGGENVYPVEIEEVMSKHLKIAQVAVIGVPDDKWGEAVKALIILKKDETATEKEIIDWCRERLAGYKIPKSVEFRDSFPISPIGKIIKRELRAPYWAGREAAI